MAVARFRIDLTGEYSNKENQATQAIKNGLPFVEIYKIYRFKLVFLDVNDNTIPFDFEQVKDSLNSLSVVKNAIYVIIEE